MENGLNRVELIGIIDDIPKFSHENHGLRFYMLPLSVERLSGALDRVNIILSESAAAGLAQGMRIKVTGELRSFNNKSGFGSRLVITVLASEAAPEDGPVQNAVTLSGTVCKPPIYRRTPLGRDICDVMLAVNRHYSRADYLPCIFWGDNAKRVSEMTVGTELSLLGRIQSRIYIKQINGVNVERTAFEVSVQKLLED